jgi:hypothetical protein
MSGNDKTKQRKKAARAPAKKPPPRWRRYLVQAELELPPPPAGAQTTGASNSLEWAAADRPVPTLRWWQTPLAVGALVACGLLLVVATAWSLRRAAIDRKVAVVAERRAQALTIRAATDERDLRVAPNPRSWSAAPDLVLQAPEPPQTLNLYFPVGYAPYPSFAVIIDKADHGRVITVHRISPDSNHDLRLALNSSAFGPGEYRLRIQGYTWQGDRIDAGWVRMLVR